MTKYTKRQYLADIAANNMAQADLAIELATYANRLEAGESIDSLSDAWNAAHDRSYQLEQERFEIEHRWMRRDWTGADYSRRDLVAANID